MKKWNFSKFSIFENMEGGLKKYTVFETEVQDWRNKFGYKTEVLYHRDFLSGTRNQGKCYICQKKRWILFLIGTIFAISKRNLALDCSFWRKSLAF